MKISVAQSKQEITEDIFYPHNLEQMLDEMVIHY